MGGTQIEEQVEQRQQQQQRHQPAAHQLLVDVDSECIQAAIQRLFNGIARLGGIAALNIQCLVYRPSDIA